MVAGINLLLIFQILYVVTIISAVIIILFENRNPQKSISWILAIIFIPFLGIILYFFFGEDHRRLRKVKKHLYHRVDLKNRSIKYLESIKQSNSKYWKLSRLLKNINNAPIIAGNKVQIFSDGKTLYDQMAKDIEEAKSHIHVLLYKIIDDEVGLWFRDILIKKAQEGVSVRVLYDDFGSIKTKKKYFREMKAGGVEVATFLPIKFPRFIRQINYRNHKKQVVIDGRISYVGGMNVANPYVYGVAWGTKKVWRDMHLRIEGSASHAIQRDFISDWHWTAKEELKDDKVYYPELEITEDNPIQIVSSGPLDIAESIANGFFEAINCAQEKIWVQTPYFIPNQQIMASLQNAAMIGLDVRVVIPAQSDNRLVDAGSFSYVKDLLIAKVKVYLYEGGFLHSKALIIDDDLLMVGSANMDVRSFDLSFETSAFVYDKQTVKRAEEIFLSDLEDSSLVTLDQWQNRPLFTKFFHSVMRLFTPLF